MKKIFYTFFALCFFAGAASLFAQEVPVTENAEVAESESSDAIFTSAAFEEADSLISNAGPFMKEDILGEKAGSLSFDEKTLLYEKYKKNPTLVGLLNGFVGFGLGSFLQGEWVNGLCFATVDTLSTAAFVYFLVASLQLSKGTDSSEAEQALGSTFGMIVLIGVTAVCGIVMIASRAVGAGTGVAVTNTYNAKLKKALGLSEEQSVAVLPIINPVDKEGGLALSLKL